MSDSIDDDGAKKFDAGLLPLAMLDQVREIAKTGQFHQDGKKYMGSSLLYPFYGGKKLPDTTLMSTNGWPITIKHDAREVYDGQSAVIIANALPTPLDITRPYRDGGYMLGIPYDPSGTENRIPGRTSLDGKDYFGVGAYLNDGASIFYGSGAVLYLKPQDTSFSTIALGYGVSVNGGYGMHFTVDTSTISDPEAWYKKWADDNDHESGDHLGKTNGKMAINLSVANSISMDNDHGGVFTLLIEPA